jgi:hypothetical protein
MLDIQTFDARRGGNVLYKAFTHPLAAEAIAALAQDLRAAGSLAVFDPDGVAAALYALHPEMPAPAEYYVQDVDALNTLLAGVPARPITDLPHSAAARVLVAAFEASRTLQRVAGLCPAGMQAVSLDSTRLPPDMLTSRAYLDRLNFATNHAFFRDADGLSTRLISANYWAGYGATHVRLWLRLFAADGAVLATWEQPLAPNGGGFTIDSAAVRARFDLPEFAGQLFIHAIGVAGHDVVKYALDTYRADAGPDGDHGLSVTHDANAWPSDRYAGLPAPNPDERVMLWVQNSHAAPIPAGAITLNRMGAETSGALPREVAPFASVAVDVAELLPGLHWPAQIELRTGRHVVRPRYEIHRGGHTRIAHVNVERADLRPDPGIRTLSNLLGRGYILPFPVLPPVDFRTIVQPNPMAERQDSLPVRLDVFTSDGRLAAQRFLGNLPRDHDLALDLADLDADAGHAELAYDFRNGGEADGWLHGLFRYEHRRSGHAADTSFGAHIFNTAMTYRDEPQSYSGPPPGLTTRLFLKLGIGARRSFSVLIYPASASWHEFSSTELHLIDSAGAVIATRQLRIACSGSAMIRPHELFGAAALDQAGEGGHVLVRDTTCRLFGYHGLDDGAGGFSLDHMFGF